MPLKDISVQSEKTNPPILGCRTSSTLLVPLEKLVLPAALGDILQTNIFGTQRFNLTMHKPHQFHESNLDQNNV